MSLEFNRRSFLKYSAAAAVVVAGSGLLTGCGDDEYQPTGTLGSTLTLMGKYTLTPAKLVSTSTSITTSTTAATATETGVDSNNKYILLCDLEMKCTSKYGLSISKDNFQIEVTPSSSSTTTIYHPGNAEPTNGVNLTLNNRYLSKDSKTVPDTLKTTLYVTNIVLQDGDTIKIKYWPRNNASEGTQSYTRAFVTWTVKVGKENDKMVITKK